MLRSKVKKESRIKKHPVYKICVLMLRSSRWGKARTWFTTLFASHGDLDVCLLYSVNLASQKV